MLERSHSFNIRDKGYDDIQQIMENVLEKDLSLSTNSKRLGRSLLRINYFDTKMDRENQKNNRITILQEPEKRIYVQINGKLTDTQISQFWNKFEKNLNKSIDFATSARSYPSEDDIILEIKNLIDERGYSVKVEEVKEFVKNFIEKYDRFPKKDEINAIVKGYIVMVNEETLYNNSVIDVIKAPRNTEPCKTILENNENDLSITSNDNTVLVMPNGIGRRKCPVCGNEGLIHEMIDKSVIILDYPKIYGKKNCCAECGHEWREH